MRKKRIVLLPLDERPCNYLYPMLMPKTACEIILPPKEILGDKKQAGDVAKIGKWLLEQAKGADAVVVSLDMLVYGGIVPSRLHHTSAEVLKSRTDILPKIKAANPQVKLYAFGLIMRCPTYSSDAEEPEYYALWGKELHLYGKYSHLEQLGQLTPEQQEDFSRVRAVIPKAYVEDFTARRKTNLSVLMHNLQYVQNGTADYFIIPQDDAAVYGFTAMDQMVVRRYLKENILHTKTAMYPSADDTGLTLLARAVAELLGFRPKVYVHFASVNGGNTIPIVEDRMVAETIKYHILSIGGVQVYSLPEADMVLAVNVGSSMPPARATELHTKPYDIERNLAEFVNHIEYALQMDKIVAVADIAWLNMADTELTALMYKEGLLLRVQAYAGWNTSSNTVGTTLCQAVLYFAGKDETGNQNFLLHRYYEDIGYMAHTRQQVTEQILPAMGYTYHLVDGQEGAVAKAVEQEIATYMQKQYPLLAQKVQSVKVKMPWSRMFEAEVRLECK